LCTSKTNEDGSPTDCERFAQYVEGLAHSTSSDAEFVAALMSALAGISGESWTPNGSPTVTFGNTGFRSELVDDRNPARHYTAYVGTAYRAGFAAGAGAAIYREVNCSVGCSIQDVRLGVIGAAHGVDLQTQVLFSRSDRLLGVRQNLRFELANWIRRDL